MSSSKKTGRWAGFLPDHAVVMARIRHEQAVLPAEQEMPVKAPVSSAPRAVKVLIFLEHAPDPSQSELLGKMMAAIGISEAEFAVEWGDFPSAHSTFVIGSGLGTKKAGRLAALRPDWTQVPSLEEVATQPAKKREAWTRLQALEKQMRLPR
jgi:hypothetical protein